MAIVDAFTGLTIEPLVDSLPIIGEATWINPYGLIDMDTFTLDWENFTDSDTSLLNSGEITIYREKIYTGSTTDDYVYWNLYSSISADVTDPSTEENEDASSDAGDYIKVFDIALADNEMSALEAKYSQTDYSIGDVSLALIAPLQNSITGSIGTAFSSVISKAITTSRLSTKFIWNKSHQKPFKKPNETAIGTPTDDE